MSPVAPSAPSYSAYDFQSDPVYQQALALGNEGVSDAQANASAQRQQALIGYGYNDSLANLFGGDSNLIDSAKNNPFSYVSNLAHQFDQGNQTADRTYNENHAALLDALNKQGLFYSSTGKNDLADALKRYTDAQSESARNYQSSLSSGASGLRSLLGQIDSGVLQAQQKAAADQQAAAQQAYINSLIAALNSGTTTDTSGTYVPGSDTQVPGYSYPDGTFVPYLR